MGLARARNLALHADEMDETMSRKLLTLEIVSHCWNYSKLLTYQLSSLVQNPPESASVKMTVFYSAEDRRTRAVLDYFSAISVQNITWNLWLLRREQLLNRAIGRNLAAVNSESDWIWFADCDICFGTSALDCLAQQLKETSEDLVYPRRIWNSVSHAAGDVLIDVVDDEPTVLDFSVGQFKLDKCKCASGAIQIVRGAVARKSGYCKRSRRQRPSNVWLRTMSDVAFRRSLSRYTSRNWRRITIPSLYRIRHSRRGRTDAGVEL